MAERKLEIASLLKDGASISCRRATPVLPAGSCTLTVSTAGDADGAGVGDGVILREEPGDGVDDGVCVWDGDDVGVTVGVDNGKAVAILKVDVGEREPPKSTVIVDDGVAVPV